MAPRARSRSALPRPGSAPSSPTRPGWPSFAGVRSQDLTPRRQDAKEERNGKTVLLASFFAPWRLCVRLFWEDCTMFTLSAFADEISPDPQVQVDILKQCGIRHIELRSILQTNVLDLTDLQVQEFNSLLHKEG